MLNVGGGVFSNYTYNWNADNSDWDSPNFYMGNVTYSGMLGYRSGFNSDNYKFSSTGRDMNRGNVVALFYQSGSIDAEGLSNLDLSRMKEFLLTFPEHTEVNSETMKFNEYQIGVVWREFLRLSGGKGIVSPTSNIEFEDMDYTLFTTGVNLRFGRLCPTLNWTLMSADNFETTMSRFDIQICMNIYFWKKILYKDKHLITE